MFKTSLKNNLVSVCAICAVILVDVVAKKIVKSCLVGKSLGGNFLMFGNFPNDKGLFGLVSLTPAVVVSVVVFAFILHLFFHADVVEEKISLSLILGGGISNFSERLLFGRVTDIVAIGNFGVMNMADVAIFVGMVWYVYLLIKKYK